jgi:predicted extracellular nuclease
MKNGIPKRVRSWMIGAALLAGVSAQAQSTATDLFFSEYVEGSSNNKYIEVYNGTGAPVNLADYQLRNYANGSATPSITNALSGTLSSGATIVFKNSAAVIYAGSATNQTAVAFNGDDAMVLWKVSSNSPVDIFGVIGNDPGTSWTGTDGITSFNTENRTLRRKCGVTGGITVNPVGTGTGAFTTLTTEWEQSATDDVSGLGSHTTCYAPAFCTTDLLFSEYIEGSSNNKCIEIYNGTGAPVDLATGGYRLKVYSNGNVTTSANIALTGTIAHNDVYVICNPSAGAAFLGAADATDGGVSFNGNDAVVLEKGAGVVVDIFGRIGENPGTAWTASGISTLDRTLQRKITVTAGVTVNPAAGFPTLGTEWNDLGLNFVADLGSHTVTCGSSVTPPSVNLGNDQFVCAGTSITLDGGATATSYAWSTGATSRFITVTASGTYAVTATNSGGSSSDAVALQFVAPAVVAIAPSSITACSGSSQTFTATSLANGLFISEYVEGSGNNKAIEIYNGTGAAIDLSAGGYSLEISFNGGTGLRNIALTGTIAAGGTYVVVDANATAAILALADQIEPTGLFNGDDAISLKQAAATIDIFGVVGNDPGTQWWSGPGTTGIRTSDRTLLRNCNVFGGVSANSSGTGVNAFNSLGTEWSELGTDDISNLGSFTACPAFAWSTGATGASITVVAATSQNYSVSVVNNYGCSSTATAALAVSNPIVVATGATTVCPGTSALLCATVYSRDLIISEYVEGSGFTKYIEIYNGTDQTVNLAGYQLLAYQNGAATPTFVSNLSSAGSLAAGATLVAANPQAITYSGAVQVYFGVNHNGNDAIALYNSNTGAFVDIFGRIGEDPGTAWVSGSNQTVDRTLRRNGQVVDGVTVNPIAGFPTLGTEWTQSGINDVSGLGSHAITASGSFAWSDGQTGACITVTPQATTDYTVTYTDGAGCTATSSVTVTTFAQPIVDAGADQVVYNGYAPAACATLTATASSGSAPYSYAWSNGATTASTTVCPTTSTTYTVTVTDANGCTSTDAATVCVVDVVCGNNNHKVVLCHVPPGNPGNAQTICIAPSAVATHLANGSYLGACGTTTACDGPAKQGASAEAGAVLEGLSLTAFPNPFASSTTLRFVVATSGDAALEIFDVQGTKVATLFEGAAVAGETISLDLQADGMAQGLYFARLTTVEGSKMIKLILQQ